MEIKAASNATGVSYNYDANGNMISDGNNCYEYNEANQMKKVKTCTNNETIAEYTYDYNGNRMVKKNYSYGTLINTVTSWSDLYETKVIVGGNTENTSYYFANNELIAKKNSDGSRYYYHNDHLGSTSVLTDSTGALVEETKYDPWGEVKVGGVISKFLYTGQEKDSETGLNYYNARYYNSHIRRFIQPDDIIQNVFEPQTLNRYSYVRNNPLKYTDPTGHIATNPFGLWITPYIAPKAQYSFKSIGGSSLLSSLNTKSSSSNQSKQLQPSGSVNNIINQTNKSVQSALSSTKPNNGSLLGSNIITNSYNKTMYSYGDTLPSILPSKGYINIGISVGVGGLGVSTGVMMNSNGYYYYKGGGATTPGFSPNITYSSSKPELGDSVSMTGSAVITISMNAPMNKEYNSFKEYSQDLSFEIGLSSPGVSMMDSETYESHSWTKIYYK